MKLPDIQDLKCEEHRLLYEHDLKEYFCSNAHDFFANFYRHRFRFVDRVLEGCYLEKKNSDKSQFKILDVGCAQGNFSLSWAEKGFDVTGLDLRKDFLSYAMLKYEKGLFLPVVGSVESLPFLDDSFDFVFAGELIEHVAEPLQLIQELKRVCKSDGCILLTTPNGNRLFQKLPHYSQVHGSSDLKQQQFKPDADGHLFLMTKSELCAEGKKAGLHLEKHQFFAAPWVTGRMGWRFIFKKFYGPLAVFLDALFMRLPLIAGMIADNHLVLLRKKMQ